MSEPEQEPTVSWTDLLWGDPRRRKLALVATVLGAGWGAALLFPSDPVAPTTTLADVATTGFAPSPASESSPVDVDEADPPRKERPHVAPAGVEPPRAAPDAPRPSVIRREPSFGGLGGARTPNAFVPLPSAFAAAEPAAPANPPPALPAPRSVEGAPPKLPAEPFAAVPKPVDPSPREPSAERAPPPRGAARIERTPPVEPSDRDPESRAMADGPYETARLPVRSEETAGPTAPVFRYHTVRDGDSLSELAETYLGDPARSGEIFATNSRLLKDPDLLPIGAKLKIDVAAPPPTPVAPPPSVEAAAPAPAREPPRAKILLPEGSPEPLRKLVPFRSSMPVAKP